MKKKSVHSSKKRESKTLFGALSLSSQTFYWKQAQMGNSAVFIQFLHQLHKAKPNKKIALIIDNGPIHRSKKVANFIKKHHWIDLHYLPSYSPEYNPIELFWKWLKRKVYGSKGFNSIEQLIASVRKFIWHYNEDRLIDPIKFEFNAYKLLL